MDLPLSKANRRYGAHKDTPDPRDLGLTAMPPNYAIPRTARFTPSVDLEEWCGPKMDQGELGSCTAFAGAGMREWIYRRFNHFEGSRGALRPENAVFSPLFLYYMERWAEGTLGQDAGAQVRTSVKTMHEQGICLETVDPYLKDQYNVPPTPDQTQDARRFMAGAYHRISTVVDMKSCLAAREPYVFLMGFGVYESFESDQVAATGLMPIPQVGEMFMGGHCVLVIGFDDAKVCPGVTAPGAFKIRNSWGADWGDKGNFWMPYQFAANPAFVWDCWMQHLGPAWK